MVPEPFEKEIQRLERRIMHHADQEGLIAFYGSSSIRLWVNIRKDLSPLNTLNLGFGGSTFDWMNYYAPRLFQKIIPQQVVLYGGDNDLSQGFSPVQIQQEFEKLLHFFRTRFPDTILHHISIKPSPYRIHQMSQIMETNQLLKQSNERQINIYQTMLNGANVPDEAYFLKDLLHLNRKGYEVWKKEVRRYFGV
jgi:lysophospholipase L1-like esterase